MSLGYQEILATLQSDGPSLSNSAAATTILQSHAKKTLPPGYFDTIGKSVRITAFGRLSNIVTTPGTLQLDVRMGPTSNISVFSGGPMQLSSTAHTTLPWWMQIVLTCRSVGVSGTLFGQGVIMGQPLSLTAVADSTTTPATLLLPNTTPAVGTAFDTTVASIVDLVATFSIANVGNLIQTHGYVLESLN